MASLDQTWKVSKTNIRNQIKVIYNIKSRLIYIYIDSDG